MGKYTDISGIVQWGWTSLGGKNTSLKQEAMRIPKRKKIPCEATIVFNNLKFIKNKNYYYHYYFFKTSLSTEDI